MSSTVLFSSALSLFLEYITVYYAPTGGFVPFPPSPPPHQNITSSKTTQPQHVNSSTARPWNNILHIEYISNTWYQLFVFWDLRNWTEPTRKGCGASTKQWNLVKPDHTHGSDSYAVLRRSQGNEDCWDTLLSCTLHRKPSGGERRKLGLWLIYGYSAGWPGGRRGAWPTLTLLDHSTYSRERFVMDTQPILSIWCQ